MSTSPTSKLNEIQKNIDGWEVLQFTFSEVFAFNETYRNMHTREMNDIKCLIVSFSFYIS